MKNKKHDKVREIRIQKSISCAKMAELVNPLRLQRGAKPISGGTYYKKEIGEIPTYTTEAEEFSKVLNKSYRIFYI